MPSTNRTFNPSWELDAFYARSDYETHASADNYKAYVGLLLFFILLAAPLEWLDNLIDR